MPGLPATKTVYLPYHMEFTTSSSSLTYNTFRSNSIYDPDFTNVGHQPRGHDQYAQYYKYYRVTGIKIRAIFNWEETPSQSHAVGVYLDDNSTFAYSGSIDLYEKAGKMTRFLSSDRAARQTISRALNLNKLGNKALNDQRTAFGSNPTLDGPFIHVWTIPNNTTSLTYGAVRVHVALVLTTQLFEPLDIGGS